MKEIVLPVSGDIAQFERVKFSDLMACMSAPILLLALIERLVTIDGRKVDAGCLDSMALADAMVLTNLVNAELQPAVMAKGVA